MKKHTRRTKAEWLALFQQQKESHQNATEFCRLHHLNDKYYSKRKGELLGAVKNKHNANESSFIKVIAPSLPLHTQLTESQIALTYRGAQLHLPANTDIHWLSSLLSTLP